MFLKSTNSKETHFGLKYKTGLNTDPLPFAKEGSCCPGGIYYTTPKYICRFIGNGEWIREVTIPKDAQKVKDPGGDKWRASKVILGKRRSLKKLETWKWLIENRTKINDHNAGGLVDVIEQFLDTNNFGIVKYLIKNGHKISVSNLETIIDSENLDILKLCIQYGWNINLAMQLSILGNNVRFVKYLISKGANIKTAFKWAKIYCEQDRSIIINYLKTKLYTK